MDKQYSIEVRLRMQHDEKPQIERIMRYFAVALNMQMKQFDKECRTVLFSDDFFNGHEDFDLEPKPVRFWR